MLAAVAAVLVVVEPFPKGKVLLSLTSTHGVDAGDIPRARGAADGRPFRHLFIVTDHDVGLLRHDVKPSAS